MRDRGRFYLLIVLSIFLVLLIIVNNIFQDFFSKEIGAYLERRFYYERVISKKGLSLHRAMYWREEKRE